MTYKYPKPYTDPPPHEVKVIQKDIAKYLKHRGVYFYKPSSQHKKGTPDFLCCYRGIFVGLEAKRPFGYGKLSDLQKLAIKEIKDKGGYAFVVHDVYEVEQCLKEIDDGSMS